MALLKRKRSDSELSFSSGSTFSSPPRPGSSSFDFCTMAMVMDGRPPAFSPIRSRTPSHLHSRTMKRFRNNRPSDEEVHRHTLSLLYSAQHQPGNFQQQRTLDQIVTAPTAPIPHTHGHTQPVSQRSLHSFWNLPAPASSATTPSPSSSGAASPSLHRAGATPSNCEDCGAGLGGAGDDAMDVDGFGLQLGGGEDCCCGACGKPVCFGCSVGNLGEQRRCLACA